MRRNFKHMTNFLKNYVKRNFVGTFGLHAHKLVMSSFLRYYSRLVDLPTIGEMFKSLTAVVVCISKNKLSNNNKKKLTCGLESTQFRMIENCFELAEICEYGFIRRSFLWCMSLLKGDPCDELVVPYFGLVRSPPSPLASCPSSRVK